MCIASIVVITDIKSIQRHDSIVRLSQKIVSFTLHYITLIWTVDREIPGSSPMWVPISYEARSTAHGLPEPSSPRGN